MIALFPQYRKKIQNFPVQLQKITENRVKFRPQIQNLQNKIMSNFPGMLGLVSKQTNYVLNYLINFKTDWLCKNQMDIGNIFAAARIRIFFSTRCRGRPGKKPWKVCCIFPKRPKKSPPTIYFPLSWIFSMIFLTPTPFMPQKNHPKPPKNHHPPYIYQFHGFFP